jgi:hypothetical protein
LPDGNLLILRTLTRAGKPTPIVVGMYGCIKTPEVQTVSGTSDGSRTLSFVVFATLCLLAGVAGAFVAGGIVRIASFNTLITLSNISRVLSLLSYAYRILL